MEYNPADSLSQRKWTIPVFEWQHFEDLKFIWWLKGIHYWSKVLCNEIYINKTVFGLKDIER